MYTEALGFRPAPVATQCIFFYIFRFWGFCLFVGRPCDIHVALFKSETHCARKALSKFGER